MEEAAAGTRDRGTGPEAQHAADGCKVRDAAEALRQLRKEQLSEERPSRHLDAAGILSALSILATPCATWVDQTSVLTARGQACCRLALAFNLVPRLCPDESPYGLVPEPDLLQHIGRHLLDQAVQRKIRALEDIKARAIEILDRVIPELSAAHDCIRILRKQDMLEARDITPKQCRPVCEAVCVLMDKKPQVVGDES